MVEEDDENDDDDDDDGDDEGGGIAGDHDDDDDTEEGEEKPRPVNSINSYERTLLPTRTGTTLVGAKRRKCNLAHKIDRQDKVKDVHV
jgi:hypothetical protein